MFSQNEKEWILEAINHLKRRKARPDFSRISLRMKRKHQLTITQTRQLLDSLVESGIVVKAVYKNNTSYRDVSKWKRGKLGGQILNSSRMLQRFVKAITSKLSSSAFDRKGTGVSAKEIEEWLSHDKEDKCFLSGAALRDAIENEVSNGYLNKLEINNESFYSVNSEKVLDVNSQQEAEQKSVKNDVVANGHYNSSDTPSSSSISQLDDDFEFSDDDFSSLKLAIHETEEERGKGSTFEDIEHWINENLSSKSSLCRDKGELLQDCLKILVKSGFINEKKYKNETFYSVNKSTADDDTFGFGTHDPNIEGKVVGKGSNECNDDDKLGVLKYNLPPLLEMPPKSSSKTTAVSLRPPSKRKRIMKNLGPDFEMELPTKSKARFTAVTTKEYSFPTPLDSPVSEKSETHIEQSFKFDQNKKKRGRPKKLSSPDDEQSQSNQLDDDMDTTEEGKNDGPSEQLSVCQDDNEDCASEAALLPDVSTWTAQQVADHFLEQGYQEESKQMLENDLDGAALGLLRRSDIVAPPGQGMLKIKRLGVALKLFRDIRNFLYQGNADNYMDPYEERAFYRS